MDTHSLVIQDRERQGAGELASLADFTVINGDPVDPAIILTSPNINLYCLDHAAKRAIFAELPEGVELAGVPFVYRTQYEQAKRLIAVSYATFRQLAHTLPPVEKLIMVYISGRSGSTLISQIFNELDEVLSLSEPDVGTQFVHLRRAGTMDDAELRDLLDCTVRMLFKDAPSRGATTFALKLRSETLLAMDLYQATFPGVKNLFSYRDAAGFAASFYRILTKAGFPETLPLEDAKMSFGEFMATDIERLIAYLDPVAEQVVLEELMTLWWIAVMEWYLAKYDSGIPVLAVRYADLNQKREATLHAIFDYCGLPSDNIQQALNAYERDSQAGSFLARENPGEGNSLRFSDDQLERIHRIMRQHPVIQKSDFIAPGTPAL